GVTSVFPQLATAVDEIIACLHIAEVAQENYEDYKSLASELEEMSKNLNAIIGEVGDGPEDQDQGLAGLARSVSKAASFISEKKTRSKTFTVFEAKKHEAYLVEFHRQIQVWSIQLQAQTNLTLLRDSRMQLRFSLLQRLFPVEYAKYNSSYSEVAKRRDYIQETPVTLPRDLEEWLRSENSPTVYWMTGDMGTEKTTIAYNLSEWLDKQERLGASFFCSRDTPPCDDSNRIVPTIAYQLARYSLEFQHSLCKVLSKDPDAGALGVGRQLDALILDILQDSTRPDLINKATVIVIDALDECKDQVAAGLLVEALLRNASSLPFKIFVTSRLAPPTGSFMTAPPAIKLCNTLSFSAWKTPRSSSIGYAWPIPENQAIQSLQCKKIMDRHSLTDADLSQGLTTLTGNLTEHSPVTGELQLKPWSYDREVSLELEKEKRKMPGVQVIRSYSTTRTIYQTISPQPVAHPMTVAFASCTGGASSYKEPHASSLRSDTESVLSIGRVLGTSKGSHTRSRDPTSMCQTNPQEPEREVQINSARSLSQAKSLFWVSLYLTGVRRP
ncbi:unnamed protein product, partial [Rhizoctonia solani]